MDSTDKKRSGTPNLKVVGDEDRPPSAGFFSHTRPWLASSLLHAAVLALLAFWVSPVVRNLDPFDLAIAPPGEQMEDEIEFFDTLAPEEPVELSQSLDVETPALMPEPEMAMAAPQMIVPTPTLTSVTLDASELAREVIAESAASPFDVSGFAKSATAGRSAEARAALLKQAGGTAGSEKAVSDALRWLANHQLPDGGWTLKMVCGECSWLAEMPEDPEKAVPLILRPTPVTRNGATALALLPMLGAGHTHVSGVLQAEVAAGLRYLIGNIDRRTIDTKGPFKGLPVGRLVDRGGNYYSHALATIAICEALAMSKDPSLIEPAQLLVNEIVYAQDPQGGGWRYSRRMTGDLSVSGWQFMALKSAHNAGLEIPATTVQGAIYFLDSVQQPLLLPDGKQMTYASYEYRYGTFPTKEFEINELRSNPSRTAIGLLCRMYLGVQKVNPIVADGVKWLGKKGPSVGDKSNVYYNYYATQVMRHFGGTLWEQWNEEMREFLIQSQSQSGHEQGSWIFDGSHSVGAGRLYCTSLCTMVLEVYYRHLPLYQDVATEELTGSEAMPIDAG